MERLASLVLKFCFILTFFCYTFANILNYSRSSGKNISFKARLATLAVWAANGCLLQGKK